MGMFLRFRGRRNSSIPYRRVNCAQSGYVRYVYGFHFCSSVTSTTSGRHLQDYLSRSAGEASLYFFLYLDFSSWIRFRHFPFL